MAEASDDASKMQDWGGRLLAELEPGGVPPDGGWQQRKSAQTRVAILEAAIDCLEMYGHSRLTTQLIAKRAEISRGAMLHHYATKQELVASLIDYLMYKRMQQFIARIRSLSEEARVQQHAGIELYWESLLSREFTAYLELSLAARTDPELREIFIPRARQYDRVERDEILRAFPEWSARPAAYKLAMDYCIATMEGLLLNRDIWDDRSRRLRLRQFVSQTILKLRDGEWPITDAGD
jgi:AcrR family transcriptional regulator